MKLPEDALNVQKMNVKDGGKQPLNFMKDKYMGWSGGEDGETRWTLEGNEDSAEGERGGCQWLSFRVTERNIK